jgi:lipopolysaccharide transport system permease protein
MKKTNPPVQASLAPTGQTPGAAVHIHIEPPGRWSALELGQIWRYRELLFFLVWRDIKVRYKQTALGVAWALLQPFLTMVVFSFFFGRLAQVPSDGLPYPLFTFAALLPWQLFSYALNESSNSLVVHQRLITRVYFPRLLIPLAAVLAGLVDFFLALGVLLAMMAYYGVALTAAALTLPLFLLLALATAFGVGLWLSALNVQYRDVRFVLPFLTQFWLFITPIAYPSSLAPEWLRPFYALNPLVGVVEGFRWALLGAQNNAGPVILISSLMVLFVLVSGLFYFQRSEKFFADLV